MALLTPALAQSGPTPYSGAPVTISPTATTRIEAENYDKGGEGIAFHDVDNGGMTDYRTDNIGVYDDYNASGGFGVGWTFQSEWYGYTLQVAQAGSYALTARLSSPAAGGSFHLEFGPVGQIGGAGLFCSASFSVPYTGGWNSYGDVTVPAVHLPAGLLWMRVVVDSPYPCNFDFFRVTPVTAAPAVSSLSLSPSPVAGGGSVGASVTLSGPAPVGGTPVALASDSPATAPVPSSLVVPAGSNTGYFSFVAGAVTTQTTAHVTASGGGGSASAALTVAPAASLLSFYAWSYGAGGQDAYGYLSLNGPAPAGGLSVALTSDSPAASPPATVTVPAGSSFASFPIATSVVSTQTTATLQASAGGVTQTCALSISPFGLSSLSVSPNSLHGGEPATGYLSLNGGAPTGGLSVALTSDNPAATVPASVSIPAGNNYASFPVTTSAVSTLTTATLTASGPGSPVTATLTLNPPSTPTNLTATAQATGPGTVLVTLSWTAGAGAIGYSLERSQDYDKNWVPIASPTGTSYQDVTAAAGVSYSYRVKAANGSGYSNVASVSTALPYLVATDLEWTPGQPVVGDQVHFLAVIQNVGTAPSAPFTWNVEFEGDPGETGYNIEANPLAPGDTLLVVPPWQSFWTATAGVHHIDVVINNSYVSLSKRLVVAPSAPATLSAASAPGGGIDLSWSASSGATSYTLYRGTTAGAETAYKSSVTGTAYQDVGLTAGQTYFYKVSAVAGGLEGSLSNEASAAPGVGTGAGSVSGLDLGFESPYLGTDLTSYAVNPPGTPWTFNGSAGISGNGTYVTYGNPAAPEGVQVGFVQGTSSLSQSLTSSSAGAWTVTFSAAQRGNVFNGGLTLQVLLDSTLLGTVTPSGTSYSDYTVGPVTLGAGVHTLSFVGTSPNNNNMALLDNVRIHIAALPAPAAPTNLTATAGNAQVLLTWTASAGAASYNLYRGTASGTETLYKSGLTGTSYTDTATGSGTVYYYQASAMSADGTESGRSGEAIPTPAQPFHVGHWVKSPVTLTPTMNLIAGLGGMGSPTNSFPFYSGSLYSYTSYAGDYTLSGSVTFTWTHDVGQDDTNDPPPQKVLVHETADIIAGVGSFGGPPLGSTTADTGLPHQTYLDYIDGTHVLGDQWVVKDGSGGTVTVTLPTATMHVEGHFGDGLMYGTLDASISSVTIDLSGTTPDTSGGDNILIGQGCTAGLSMGGGITLSNYQWNVSGDTFASFEMGTTPGTLFTSGKPYGHVNSVDPSEWTKPNPHWYWKKGSDSGDEKTVSVTADASLDGVPIGSVSAEKKVKVWEPTRHFHAKGGPAELNEEGGWKVQGDMAFQGDVEMPGLFDVPWDAGYWQPTQLCDLYRKDTDRLGGTYTFSTNGFVLDAEFNYGSTNLNGPSPWPADRATETPTVHPWSDLPDHPLDFEIIPGHALDYVMAAVCHDTFETYIMFMPPGSDTQWVPLHKFVWLWDVDITKTGTTDLAPWLPDPPGYVTVPGDSDTSEFPSWTDSYSP